MWRLIDSRDVKGFTINTYVEPEMYDPADELDDEIVESIKAGRLEWFRVMVTANKVNVELGSDLLGGCCYESFEDFLGCEYWSDMVETAITEAREIIEELKK